MLVFSPVDRQQRIKDKADSGLTQVNCKDEVMSKICGHGPAVKLSLL